MSIIGLQGIQAELVTALTEITGYVPELFGPHVELVNDLGLTPTEVQDAVALVERKLQLPSEPRSRGATVAAIAAELLKHQDKGGPVDTDLDVTLEQVLAFVEECEARNERPVLETLLLETRGALARLDAAVEERRADAVTPDTVTPDAVMKLLVEALVERTGYSADMLEPDMDLEADLGIDTVKQVEAFALARVHFGVQKDDAFRLRHHNTLRKMVHYLSSRAPSAPAPVAASGAPTVEQVRAFLISVLQEKTGYNIEIIQPDLDLEVELGIDTVTQVEAFALTREKFGVPRDESFRVRHYNTVRKMSDRLVPLAREGLPSVTLPSVPAKRPLGLDDVRRFIARSEARKDTAALQRLATLLEERLRPATQPLTPPARFSARRYEVHPVELPAGMRTGPLSGLRMVRVTVLVPMPTTPPSLPRERISRSIKTGQPCRLHRKIAKKYK